MKKNPMEIMISIVHNLNLLMEHKEYNINEFKENCNLNLHWQTIKRYLKIISIVKRSSPQVILNDSKFQILFSKFYKSFSDKERFVIYLHQSNAINEDNAVEISEDFNVSSIEDSIGNLYNRVGDRFYLTEMGIELFDAINSQISKKILKGDPDFREIEGQTYSTSTEDIPLSIEGSDSDTYNRISAV